MNTDNSISDFFYNIIPGGVFLLLLKYFSLFDISWHIHDSATVIFIYITFGLFLGFAFQGLTKLGRDCLGWNEDAMQLVADDNKAQYDLIKKKINEQTTKNLFYLMDNKLRGKQAAFLPTHFSSRYAFWSNIFFAFILLAILNVVRNHFLDIPTILLLLFAWLSYYWAKKYLYAFYDSILKAYYMKEILV